MPLFRRKKPYGTDADALFAALRSCFDDAVLPHGAYAIKRYGEPDDPHAREERIALR